MSEHIIEMNEIFCQFTVTVVRNSCAGTVHHAPRLRRCGRGGFNTLTHYPFSTKWICVAISLTWAQDEIWLRIEMMTILQSRRLVVVHQPSTPINTEQPSKPSQRWSSQLLIRINEIGNEPRVKFCLVFAYLFICWGDSALKPGSIDSSSSFFSSCSIRQLCK